MADVARLLAPAKLTVRLRVVGVRDDGMHLLDAEMVTLDLADEIVVTPSSASGRANDLPAEDLVTRALQAVGRAGDVHVEVRKRIPVGAGLGGGSADAAAILRWAGCRDVEVAVALGADVPFCLVGGRALVRGVGEVVEPLPFEARAFTLVTPPVHVSTPAVYREWDRRGGPSDPNGRNDLEPAAVSLLPALAGWRDRLAAATDARPQLAGSGGTWFVEGAFPDCLPDAVVARTVPADPS